MNRRPVRLAIVSNEKEIADLIVHCGGYDLIGVFDANRSVDSSGLPILGGDDDWSEVLARHPGLKVAMAIDPPESKRRLVEHYGVDSLQTLVSPEAYVASSANLGPGCLVQRGCKIMPNASLGTACKVNTDAAIHHDTHVGNYCTLAPGSRLLGNVAVGDEIFIGAGAIVLPHVCIGSRATVGAGAVVTADVAVGKTVAGVPARPLGIAGA